MYGASKSQSAMRAIRYNLVAMDASWQPDETESQSAMRAIRYNPTFKEVRDIAKSMVAIRYACNKI